MCLFHHVDDDKTISEVFSEIMALFGHEVTSFANGLEYIAYMDSAEYHCPVAIFTDLDMPVMDGYEMIEQTLNRYPNRLIVVLSGLEDRKRLNQFNIFKHLEKPFHFHALEQLAASLSAKNRSLGQLADFLNKT